MENYLIIWPKSEDIVHINYHYTQFGEYVDYLNQIFIGKIKALDEDAEGECDIVELIEKNKISKVIVQVNYENAQNAFDLVEKIKEKYNIPVMAYGNVTVMLPQLFEKSKFDVIFKDGDPEASIKSFLMFYDVEKSIEELQKQLFGVSIVKSGKLIHTQQGKYISSQYWGMSRDGIVPVSKYNEIKNKNRYVINISRGCPFGCEHCLVQLTEGRQERRRDIQNLMKVIEQVKQQYKHIKIWAANFTLDKEYVIKLCKMIEEKFPEITWECATRIDLVSDKEMLKEMHKAGCRKISIGVESLNNKELINTKEFSITEISNAISNIKQAGIAVNCCIMLGMPNQTKEDIIKTLQFLRNQEVSIRPTIYTPYQCISGDVTVKELGKYNRKTYKNDNVEGVTSEQLVELTKNPYKYEGILKI